MSKVTKGKRTAATRDRPSRESDRRDKRVPAESPSDSDDIERAVYDGMQDLRVERDKKR